MIQKEIVKKIEKTDMEGKTVSDELGQKINKEWKKLPKWRQIPTSGNIKFFMRKLDLNADQQKEVQQLFGR